MKSAGIYLHIPFCTVKCMYCDFYSITDRENSIPTFIFYNFLRRYKELDKLFVRDLKQRYYMTGLKHTTKDLPE